jgi:diadenylate cyclase
MRGLAALLPSLPLGRLNVRSALDILIIAVLIYYLLKLLRGTRGLQILVALVLLFLLDEGARWARLGMVEWLLTTLLPYFAIALIVLFQPEIRRALARFGRQFSFGQLLGQGTGAPYDDLVLAAGHFSQNRIGALVVIERDVSLSTYIESGIALDANLSYDLLIAIFRPGSPMHDGAVILQRDRIVSAACFLPLSLNPALSNQLGTRHRAAIGVTEESDAIAVVVSEETGAISLATGGAIELDITADELQERLVLLMGRRRQTLVGASAPAAAAALRK